MSPVRVRVSKGEAQEGQGLVVAIMLKAPDGTVLTNSGAGQTGVTNVRVKVFERSASGTPGTAIFDTTFAQATVMKAAPVVGDGFTEEAEGYNCLFAIAAGDLTLQGGGVYLVDVRAPLTGSTAGVAWSDAVHQREITVLSRYAA